MLIKFRNNTFLEKPAGAKLVGLRQGGLRPVAIELDYYDFEKLLSSPQLDKYIVHLWTALAPDRRMLYEPEIKT